MNLAQCLDWSVIVRKPQQLYFTARTLGDEHCAYFYKEAQCYTGDARIATLMSTTSGGVRVVTKSVRDLAVGECVVVDVVVDDVSGNSTIIGDQVVAITRDKRPKTAYRVGTNVNLSVKHEHSADNNDDGSFCITRGHPIFDTNTREWHRPDEIYQARLKGDADLAMQVAVAYPHTCDTVWYNVACAQGNRVLLNGHVWAATLNGDCGQRLANLHPHNHAQYGSNWRHF